MWSRRRTSAVNSGRFLQSHQACLSFVQLVEKALDQNSVFQSGSNSPDNIGPDDGSKTVEAQFGCTRCGQPSAGKFCRLQKTIFHLTLKVHFVVGQPLLDGEWRVLQMLMLVPMQSDTLVPIQGTSGQNKSPRLIKMVWLYFFGSELIFGSIWRWYWHSCSRRGKNEQTCRCKFRKSGWQSCSKRSSKGILFLLCTSMNMFSPSVIAGWYLS